ncbi:hypothetical protein [Desulfosporosinus sp. SB140]|uniref:hypothetical protein n=1 Tax=Desulfosporosinus paludis TaxID=3115649 RepID=UPI0038907117
MKWRKNTVPAILIFSLIILLVGCNKENKSLTLNANQTTSSSNNIKASETATAISKFISKVRDERVVTDYEV